MVPRAARRLTRSNFLPSGLSWVISKMSSNIIGEAIFDGVYWWNVDWYESECGWYGVVRIDA